MSKLHQSYKTKLLFVRQLLILVALSLGRLFLSTVWNTFPSRSSTFITIAAMHPSPYPQPSFSLCCIWLLWCVSPLFYCKCKKHCAVCLLWLPTLELAVLIKIEHIAVTQCLFEIPEMKKTQYVMRYKGGKWVKIHIVKLLNKVSNLLLNKKSQLSV